MHLKTRGEVNQESEESTEYLETRHDSFIPHLTISEHKITLSQVTGS